MCLKRSRPTWARSCSVRGGAVWFRKRAFLHRYIAVDCVQNIFSNWAFSSGFRAFFLLYSPCAVTLVCLLWSSPLFLDPLGSLSPLSSPSQLLSTQLHGNGWGMIDSAFKFILSRWAYLDDSHVALFCFDTSKSTLYRRLGGKQDQYKDHNFGVWTQQDIFFWTEPQFCVRAGWDFFHPLFFLG